MLFVYDVSATAKVHVTLTSENKKLAPGFFCFPIRSALPESLVVSKSSDKCDAMTLPETKSSYVPY